MSRLKACARNEVDSLPAQSILIALPEAMASLFGAILLFVLPTDLRRGQSAAGGRADWIFVRVFSKGDVLRRPY